MKKLFVIISLFIVSGCATWKETTRKVIDYTNVITRNLEPTIQQQINIQAETVIAKCIPVLENECKSICFPDTVQLTPNKEACNACISLNCPDIPKLQKLRIQVAEAFQKVYTIMKYLNSGMPYLEEDKLKDLRSQLETAFNELIALLKTNKLGDEILSTLTNKEG